MPVTKCTKCGRVSNIEVNSPCLRCGEMIFAKSKQEAAKNRKIISSLIFGVLVLGLTGFGVTYFISQHRENARLEAEKKQFAEFDTINFKPDADSVANALKSVPPQFNQQPPDIDLIKRNVGEFEASKRKSEKAGSIALSSKWDRQGGQFSGYKTVSYKLTDLQPVQFDYVKAAGNRLVCFVSYQATLEIFETGAEMLRVAPVTLPGQPPPPLKDEERGNKVGEREVRETARYEFENGAWVFKSAGISDIDRLKEIDKVRIEAKTKAR